MMMWMYLRLSAAAFIALALAGTLAGQAPSESKSHAAPRQTGASPKATPAQFDDIASRAQKALQNRRLEEAAKLYRQAVGLRPTWPEGWGYLASSLYDLERYAEARDAYRQTTLLTPKNAPSWAYLGLCEYKLRDYQRAFEDLTKAEDLGLGTGQGGNDRDLVAQVKYHRAILWDTAGKFELGLGEVLWFPHNNLGSPEIFVALGLSVLRVPEFPENIPEGMRQMLILAGQASFAANSEKMDLAGKIYEQLAATYPSVPNVHFAYGQFLSHLDLDASLKEYLKEIELHPSHTYARIEAAYLYLKRGQVEEALANAQEAAKLQPGNAAAHNLVGRALMEMGKTTEAIPELVLATQLAPTNSPLHLNLARAYQRAGQKEEAAKEIAIFNELQKKQAAQQPSAPPPPE